MRTAVNSNFQIVTTITSPSTSISTSSISQVNVDFVVISRISITGYGTRIELCPLHHDL